MSINLQKIFTQRKKLWKVYRKIRNLISRSTQKTESNSDLQGGHTRLHSLWVRVGFAWRWKLHLQPLAGQPATRNRVGHGFELWKRVFTQNLTVLCDFWWVSTGIQFPIHHTQESQGKSNIIMLLNTKENRTYFMKKQHEFMNRFSKEKYGFQW